MMRQAIGGSRVAVAGYYLLEHKATDLAIAEQQARMASEPWLVYGPRGGRYVATGPVAFLPPYSHGASVLVRGVRVGARRSRTVADGR